jgi:ATP-dependent Lon protease
MEVNEYTKTNKRITRSQTKNKQVNQLNVEDSEEEIKVKKSRNSRLICKVPKKSMTRTGYIADGFVISDNEDDLVDNLNEKKDILVLDSDDDDDDVEDSDEDNDVEEDEDDEETKEEIEKLLIGLTNGIMKKHLPMLNLNNEEEVSNDPLSFLEKVEGVEKDILRTEYERLINKMDNTDLRIKVLNSKLPDNGKRLALLHSQNMYQLSETSSDFAKHRTWLETLLRIPFGIHSLPPITTEGGLQLNDQTNTFLNKLRNDLDKNIHGQENVKEDLIALACHWLSNPEGESRVLGLQGPPGVGKTCIIKEALAPALGRPFHVIALGGATQACFLDGFDFTYEGSMPGKIVNILIASKCMNPVIYFDELDKISETKEGSEIASLLIHLTDPVQCNSFEDKYFRGVSIDLSKVTFIFSFNDESKVHPILRDRLSIIRAKGFSQQDKVKIVANYILPRVIKDFNINEISFSEDAINWLVSNRIQCSPQDEGVRSIKQDIQQLVTHINVIKMAGSSISTIAPRLPNYQFPLVIDENICKTLLRKDNSSNQAPFGMYM